MSNQKPLRIQQVSSSFLYTDRRFSSNGFVSNAKNAKWRRSLFLYTFTCVSSLSVVLRDCWRENTWPFAIQARSGQPCFFSIQKIYIAREAYALTFSLRWVAIFTPIFPTPPLISWWHIWHGSDARFCRVLLHGSVGCSSVRFPAFLPSPLVWSSSSLVHSPDVNCVDECWPSDSRVAMTPSRYWTMCHFRLSP